MFELSLPKGTPDMAIQHMMQSQRRSSKTSTTMADAYLNLYGAGLPVTKAHDESSNSTMPFNNDSQPEFTVRKILSDSDSLLRTTSQPGIHDKYIIRASDSHFLKLLETGEYSDFIVKGPDGKVYKLHKFILSRSDFFKVAFSCGMSESFKQEMTLNFIDKENVFSLILKWLYGGLIEVEPKRLFGLLELADSLQIQELVKHVKMYILSLKTLDLVSVFKTVCENRVFEKLRRHSSLVSISESYTPRQSGSVLSLLENIDTPDVFGELIADITTRVAQNVSLIPADEDFGCVSPETMEALLNHPELYADSEYHVYRIISNYCGKDRPIYVKSMALRQQCGCASELTDSVVAEIISDSMRSTGSHRKSRSRSIVAQHGDFTLDAESSRSRRSSKCATSTDPLPSAHAIASLFHHSDCPFHYDLSTEQISAFFERIFFEHMTELELKEASQNPIVPKELVIQGLMEMVRKLNGKASTSTPKGASRRNSVFKKGGGEFKFSRNWDENGVIFFLGTQSSTHYRNPVSTGQVRVEVFPELREGHPSNLVSRQPRSTYTKRCEAGQSCWFTVDISPAWELAVTHYTLRHGYSQDTAESLQNWAFLGSADNGKTWRTISVHYNDDNLGGEYGTHTWPVVCDGCFYSMFKIETKSRPSTILVVSGIELYGLLRPRMTSVSQPSVVEPSADVARRNSLVTSFEHFNFTASSSGHSSGRRQSVTITEEGLAQYSMTAGTLDEARKEGSPPSSGTTLALPKTQRPRRRSASMPSATLPVVSDGEVGSNPKLTLSPTTSESPLS